MDDGSRKSNKHNTYNIHTLGYTKEDLKLVQQALLKKFGIQSALHVQRNETWRLYIPAESAGTFTDLVKQYVLKIPSMHKKLVNVNAQRVTEGSQGWLTANGNRGDSVMA